MERNNQSRPLKFQNAQVTYDLPGLVLHLIFCFNVVWWDSHGRFKNVNKMDTNLTKNCTKLVKVKLKLDKKTRISGIPTWIREIR